MSDLSVSVVAVDRKVWSGSAKLVIAKTPEGEIGIMAGHEPLLSLLTNGVVRIRQNDGSGVVIAVHGGFFAVDSNEVRILAEAAELAQDIDVNRAKSALDRAKASDDLAALHRAETRVQAAASHTAAIHV